MRIQRIEILELRIPFRFTFRHALAARSEGHGVLVRVRNEEGQSGFGECVPRAYVTGESVETVIATLRDELGPPWLHRQIGRFEDLAAAIEEGLSALPRHQHAAHCALELALLDLAGRHFERSAGDVLGPLVRTEVAYDGVVSADEHDSSLRQLHMIHGFGFERVKVKVGGAVEDDLRVLETARHVLGPACRLRIDANCSWTPQEALDRLHRLAPFQLESVEQPVAGDDISGLAWLTARSPIPVIVDESLVSMDDAQRLIRERACHHFNIRISKCGGLVNSRRLRDLAKAHGVGYQLGAQVGETVLLSAAGRHFATRTADVLFCEGSFGTILLESDIGLTDLTIRPHERSPALTGHGLGVDIDTHRLARFAESLIEVGAS